ncbi:MAG: HEAT repeat domain-containing protein [Myxococcales bacterium]|nr:HEAT repeat domain-containing protein [Myxococcales bacterium]
MTRSTANHEDPLHDRLVGLLTDTPVEHRCSAAVVLGALQIGEEDVLSGLRRALGDSEPSVRSAAAIALGLIAPKTLVRDLRPLLKDGDSLVRDAAKIVLAEGPGVQLEELVQMLEAKDEKQRMGAIAVLGARGGGEARKMLIMQLGSGSAKVQESVLEALAPEVAGLSQDEVPTFLHDVDAFVGELEDGGLERCASTLVALLAGVDHGAVTGVLSRIVEAPAPADVRISAVEVLWRASRGHRGAQEHVFKTLVNVLEMPGTPPALLSVASDTLAGMDLPIALEPRVRALTKAEQTPVRRWAIRALGALDAAPAARALALVVLAGDSSDRMIAVEAASSTLHGRRALAKTLVGITDGEQARAIASALEAHTDDLTKSILDALEDAVVEAPPEVAEHVMRILRGRGGSGNLVERGEELKAAGQWSEAADLFRRIASDGHPEAMFLLGVCELKLSKKTLGRGASHDPAVSHFRRLLKHPKFPTVERLAAELDLEPTDLYYLGFSLAEDKSDAVRGLGGDVLMGLAERFEGKPLGKKAHQKLRTMGWVD